MSEMEVTPRDFGRLESKVESVQGDVARLRGEIVARMDDLKSDFDRTTTKQGERIGALERFVAMSEGRERMLLLVWALIQAVALTIFGVWIRGGLN